MYTTIRTSQRSFITDPEQWLGKSAYFDNLFSGKWGDKQEDGSYFIETDARIFEHILRYLRTGVLPVFYDKVAGHDFPLYQALLEESTYFAIDRLQKWLCEQKYLEAVKIRHLAIETQDRTDYRKQTTSDEDGRKFMLEERFVEITTSSNVETTIIPMTVQKNSFYCPYGKHGKSTEEYCRSCFQQARDDSIVGHGGWKSEEQLRLCIVRREVTFDHNLCVEAFLGDDLAD
ncbi:hypothetical protein AA0113_g12499 [Alternaria arborescens]|jgi:hypothetical protein|uniref:Potassium channel tetramerisation-type BTB domain-containing protein n=3 Tax=Alternaria sect. Alternaria TaxID=2499237 RepID=A0A4Q4MXW2_ALTAL|nr:hypothetical protein AA0115_g12937 [Alternaria tenuissima]RYN16013.1 hypothetical protein AA0112_g12662 [Alternaria arborescens]RYN62350.1 hypothetical protein AA0117_g12927 [Alternaria alternata]RYN85748.1 hypothetical protein AA0119_g13158 [Alternaria tenuissima]RYO02873.1 hypothetical protein AA0121_g13203 [Alternaria tenuissima]